MTRPPFPKVLDSTIIANFRSCPRKFELEFLNHWKPQTPSVHLHAGAAYAKGLEVARQSYYEDGENESTAIARGLAALIQAYGDFECPPDSAKSLERTAGAFEFYFDQYPLATDQAVPTVLPSGKRAIEFSFAEPIDILHPETGDPIIYCGRMDMCVDYAGGVFGHDDKTSSSLGASWSRQWDLRSQFTGYCVTPETEVLTPDGWLPIVDLPGELPVACWSDGNIQFEVPLEHIEMEFNGNLTEFDGKVHIKATPEHRQVVFDTYSQTYKTFTMRELPRTSGSLRFLSAGIKVDGINLLPAAVRLLVAMQADGSWKDETAMNFHFTKPAKAKRLESLFNELELPFSKHNTQDGSFSYRVPKGTAIGKAIHALIGEEKLYGPWLLALNGSTLALLIEELQYWDGSSRGTRGWMYFTSVAANADWIRTAASLCGHYTSMHTQAGWKTSSTAFRVNITKGHYHAVHLTEEKQVPYNGRVYCLTVPSSYFLIRSAGRIMVTGNCWGAERAGRPLQGFLVRGVSILKTKYDTQQALTYRPPWMIERWYEQLLHDVKRMIQAWESGYWDYNLDHACAEFGGCTFRQVCLSRDPQPWLDSGFTRRVWNPLTRTEGEEA